MQDRNIIATYSERDLDLLLLEELEVSDEFRSWFSARVYEIPIFQHRIGTWHSVMDAELGESDLIYLFEANDGSRKVILIENKIDAPAQPDQGVRYQKHGTRGEEDSTWDEFRTCLVAPKKYLSSTKNTEIYDTEISYEEILAYFASRSLRGSRFAYRANVLQEGIEQNRRGYQPKISEAMTTFVEDYVSYVQKKFPKLGVEVAKPRPAGSTWIMFYPSGLTKPNRVIHQLTAGYVKIMLSGKADLLDTLKEKYADNLTENIEIQKASKSTALSAQVSEIDPVQESLSVVSNRVDEAMEVMAELIVLARQHGDL